MTLRMRVTNEAPPDNYRYTVPYDGWTISAYSRAAWMEKIKKHYRNNGYAIPENFDEVVDEQLCATLPPGWCFYENGESPVNYVNIRFELGDFLHGMSVISKLATHPDPLVTQDKADERARICAACPANVVVPGCSACHQIANKVAEIKGTKGTEADRLLKACAICKCSNQAQVWVKAEILAKGVTPDMMADFEILPHCWKAKEIKAL